MWEFLIAALPFLERISHRFRKTDPFEARAFFYPTLRDLRHSTNAIRVLVLRYHNGSGKLDPSKAIKGSIFAEECAEGVTSRTIDFQEVPLTTEYIYQVHQALKKSPGLIHADTWQDKQLKSVYQADGVETAALHPVHTTKSATFALVVQWPESKTVLSPHESSSISSAANRCRMHLHGKA